MSKEPIEGLDEDVAAEKERVLSGGASRDLIRIENLTKVSLSQVVGFNNHVWIYKRICKSRRAIFLKKIGQASEQFIVSSNGTLATEGIVRNSSVIAIVSEVIAEK